MEPAKKKSFDCPFCCDESFDCVENLKKHISAIKNRLKCSFCDEKCEDFKSFQEHFNYCSNVEEIVYVVERQAKDENFCEACNDHVDDLVEHLKHNHPKIQEVDPSSAFDEDIEKIIQPSIMRKEVSAKKFLQNPIIEKLSYLCDTITIVSENVEIENSVTVYRCPDCDIRFSKLLHYTAHRCNDMNRQVCNFCSICFKTERALSIHKHRAHGVKKKRIRSVKKVPLNSTYQCDSCSCLFDSKLGLMQHRRTHKNAPVRYKEMEAPVSYDIVGQTVEVSNKNFECPICKMEYNESYREIHMKYHDGKQYICTFCNRHFPNEDDLNLHSQTHVNDNNDDTNFLCGKCKETFEDEVSFNAHRVNVHNETKKFSCKFCGKGFSKAHYKITHERVHTGEKPYACQICGKSFRIGYCLTLHMRTHSNERPYCCNVCGKRFKSQSVHAHHLKTHSDVRAFKCPLCPKTFKTSVQLGGHRKLHTKPFACDICNRPFASMYELKAHRKSHARQNNLKHECHICGAVYARTFALRDHLLTHAEYVDEVNNTNEELINSDDEQF